MLQPDLKRAMRALNINAIYCMDYETFWDPKDYSLSKMATTEYVFDKRFNAHMVSVQKHNWAKPKIMSIPQLRIWARTVDWTRAGMLAHHAHFDGLIASHHHGIKPAVYLDTLSMARPIMPVTVGGSLKAVCAAFGRKSKTKSGVLVDTAGKRTLTAAEFKRMGAYAGDDVEDTWFAFEKLIPHTLNTELRLISTTVKMYAQPRLLINAELIDALHDKTVSDKAEQVLSVGSVFGRYIDKKEIVSNEKFADLMRELGYEPPLKISKTTNKETLALAKGDLEFKDLLKHEDPKLRALVTARFNLKSSILETRTKRMSNRSVHGKQPIYLNYWGAKTGRWSGGDKSNWQNLSRGSDMRKAVYAPSTHKLIIADLAQIEARVNAWWSNQTDVVEAFRRGEDVYCLAASKIYGRHITKANKDERFVGKVATLALGYGAGAPRFADMLRLGSFGPAMEISDGQASDIVKAWRQANNRIVANWKLQQNLMYSAFNGQQEIHDEIITYQGFKDRGIMIMPDDTYIRYDGLQYDGQNLSYCNKSRRLKSGDVNEERQKLYGGLIVENADQAMSRVIIGSHMRAIEDAMPYAQIVLSSHDEIVTIVPNKYAKKALSLTQEIMSQSPDWAKGLPVAVEAHMSQRYDK